MPQKQTRVPRRGTPNGAYGQPEALAGPQLDAIISGRPAYVVRNGTACICGILVLVAVLM